MFKAALVKLTQWPVMLQTFKDEFNLPNGPAPSTPETPGDALVKADPKDCIPADELFNYRSEVSKLLHMMRWTWPEIINAVRELFWYMLGALLVHAKAKHQTMKYYGGTMERWNVVYC
jgi:hypothetical protein